MPKPNTSARILPHPAIEDGNFSFPEGDYQVSHEPTGNSGTEVVLYHTLKGAPFIQKMIDQGKAEFACLVSVPKTGYRKLHTSKDSKQKISWDPEVAGKHPSLRPGILYVGEDLEGGIWAQEDDVAELWLNQEIYIPRGARLTRGCDMQHKLEDWLLQIEPDSTMTSGTFYVLEIASDSSDGFYFIVKAAKDIFDFIQIDHSALRNSILTHAVTACFHILQTRYDAPDVDQEMNGDEESEEESTNEWKHFPNLVALSELLKNRGLPHWSEKGFDAVKVTTELYPIKLNNSADGYIPEEDDE